MVLRRIFFIFAPDAKVIGDTKKARRVLLRITRLVLFDLLSV